MSNLLSQKCVPCEGGIPPYTPEQVAEHLKQLKNLWEVVEDGKKISYQFKFKNFKEAITFVNKVADLAESEGHHPDIHIFYNRVVIELWTHAIQGLFLNDFILAAKIDSLHESS